MAAAADRAATVRSARRSHPGSTAGSAHAPTDLECCRSLEDWVVRRCSTDRNRHTAGAAVDLDACRTGSGDALETMHLTVDALTHIADTRRNPPASTG